MKQIIQTILISAVVGAVAAGAVAFSVIENPGGGHQIVKGEKVFLASLLLNRFRVGIGIFALGFLLQFLYSVYGKI